MGSQSLKQGPTRRLRQILRHLSLRLPPSRRGVSWALDEMRGATPVSSISEAFGAQTPMVAQDETTKASSSGSVCLHNNGLPCSFGCGCSAVYDEPSCQPLTAEQLHLVGHSDDDSEEDDAEEIQAQKQERIRRLEEANTKIKSRHALMLPPLPPNRHPRVTDTALIARWNRHQEWRYCPELARHLTKQVNEDQVKQVYKCQKENSRRQIERWSGGGGTRHLKKSMLAPRRRRKWHKEKDIWSTSAKVLVERATEAGLDVPKGH